MTSKTTRSALPKKISRYEIVREIGRGGMAVVYLAHDPNFQRDVAIKVLPREALDSKTLYERFQREARTIASLDHPAIIPVYDFGEEDGQPFMVMRYLGSGSLASRLKSGPISVTDAAKMLHRIGGALDAAHAKGVVHRDLKPGNILFDQNGDAYLGDFGIAQLSSATSPLTGSAVVGTPSYMSPEQIRGGAKIDGRSDIYALGIVLFEMLTGTLPFKADTPAQVMMMQMANPTPHPTDLRGDLPEPVNDVIVRAMAKDVELRFPNASDMEVALQAAASGKSTPINVGMAAKEDHKPESGTYDVLDVGGLPPGADKRQLNSEADKKRRKKLIYLFIGGAIVFLCAVSLSVGGVALWTQSHNETSVEKSIVETNTLGSVMVPATGFPGRTPSTTAGVHTFTATEIPTINTPIKTAISGDTFQIKIGDEISNGIPGPGAGNIEMPGSKDIYIFDATAGQKIFLQLKEENLTQQIESRILDDLDNFVWDTTIDSMGFGFGAVELVRGGTYRLIIGSDTVPGVGTYKIKIWNLPPPDAFTININPSFEISNGIPGPGAGLIETPGAKDVYSFDATAGQKIFLELKEEKLSKAVEARILDDMDNSVWTSDMNSMGFGWGTVELVRGGTYRLIIGSDFFTGVGTYRIKIWGNASQKS